MGVRPGGGAGGEERREARTTMQVDPTHEIQASWWKAKKEAADVELAARERAFCNFATTKLNRPAALGRVAKILRRMGGGVSVPWRGGGCAPLSGRKWGLQPVGRGGP